MSLQDTVGRVSSGDNLAGHVLTAAMLGDGLSSIAVWTMQSFAHVDPPAGVTSGITAICMVVASVVMKRIMD